MLKDRFVSVFKIIPETPTETPQQIKLNQIKVTSGAVCKLSDFFSVNKALGDDEIANLVLRQCSHTLSLLLAIAFKTCLSKSTFLGTWNKSKVTTIFGES